jgi:hypothetical protein
MGVDVDQAGRHDLVARIDGLGGACGDVRGDGCDLAGADGDIAALAAAAVPRTGVDSTWPMASTPG